MPSSQVAVEKLAIGDTIQRERGPMVISNIELDGEGENGIARVTFAGEKSYNPYRFGTVVSKVVVAPPAKPDLPAPSPDSKVDTKPKP